MDSTLAYAIILTHFAIFILQMWLLGGIMIYNTRRLRPYKGWMMVDYKTHEDNTWKPLELLNMKK